ncbi:MULTISPECIES: efflux RND transporter permease subunit [Bacteroidota]|uniref:Efflux RND transporter permease subunit n=1 Tax=Empedobacter falsenii TaxID=343874 RepID=A0A7H9DS22_9FLAO|nr:MULTISPECIES: efflux RND transporter permease subunit [Bacteroidota]MBW3523755.1 efflux RND transporter permease subunit [Chryseobacterium sp. NKUCC03_KSP]MDM1461433.1 efflux RND transporter permease subunit [Myroides odoratimimus]QLL57609.1 efflux RND transporter permease subunit [Empedobacter falsenii]
MKRKINLIEAAMKFPQVPIAITVIMVLAGLISLLTMPRSEDPRITVRQGLVVAFYPGSDEEQIEKEVTDKLEQYLFGFEEIKKEKTHSESKPGQVVITVELQDYVKDTKKFWNTLQHGLDANMPLILPRGVQGPYVNSDFGDVVVQMIAVSAPGRTYAELENYLDELEDGIKTIPQVSKIKRYGGQKQQIYVTLREDVLKQYGFGINEIASTLSQQNVTIPSGDIEIDKNRLLIFTDAQYQNENEIGNLIVYSSPQGGNIRLQDIAKIERRYEDLKSKITVAGNDVMMLTVEMQPGQNIVDLGKALTQKVTEVKEVLPADVQVNTIVDQPAVVDMNLGHFFIEFAIAIGAVILVVMILLPFRVATISAIAAPVTILATFAILNMIGVEMHQVSLAALIIVLGMVVDDAIIVVDNYIEKVDEKVPSWTAAWQSATQLMVPIFTATLTIVLSFLPLAFTLTGMTREFVQWIPITVSIALAVSFLVALFLTPYMCYHFLKKGLKNHDAQKPKKRNFLDRMQDGFDRAIEFCMKYQKTTLFAGLAIFFLSFVVGSQVKTEFFPIVERNQFNLELWMDNGTNIHETEAAVKKIEKEIAGDKRIVTTASFIGTSSPRFYSTYSPENPRENFAQIFINTESNDATNEMIDEYVQKFNNFLPNGYVRVRQLSKKQQPAPIEIRVIGKDITQQKKVAKEVATILENTKGANWVRTDYQDDYVGLKAVVKEDIALRLGVTKAQIAQALGAKIKGFPISQMWEGNKAIDILLRTDEADRQNLDALGNMYITSSFGAKVPLKQVVDLQPSWHTGAIVHRNGLRTLTVSSEAQLGRKPAEVFAEAQPKIDSLELPKGVKIAYGGEYEDGLESGPKMGKAFMISFVLIFLVLLFQFKRVGKVFIVLASFPLSLLGAMLGLFLTGYEFGFMAIIGITALLGIVVRNGIILVDYADELVRDHGHTIKEAALLAAKRRMRPIFLTSMAAAIGLIPLMSSGSPEWGPISSTISIGILVSMVTTLFIVPVLYSRFVKPSKKSLNKGIHDKYDFHHES